MAYEIATQDIVSLAELKDALNVTLDIDDAKLGQKLDAARDYLEGWIGPFDAFEIPDNVPGAVREALKLTTGHLYDEGAATMPEGILSLIAPHVLREF